MIVKMALLAYVKAVECGRRVKNVVPCECKSIEHTCNLSIYGFWLANLRYCGADDTLQSKYFSIRYPFDSSEHDKPTVHRLRTRLDGPRWPISTLQLIQ